MNSFRHGLWNAENPVGSLSWSVFEEHHDAWFVKEETTHEVVAHPPRCCEFIYGVMLLQSVRLGLHVRHLFATELIYGTLRMPHEGGNPKNADRLRSCLGGHLLVLGVRLQYEIADAFL